MTYIDKYNDNIPGWPGYYISKHGHLYTSKYIKGRWYRVRGHINKGRLQVKLKDHGRSKQGGISRLVALAWVPNPKPEEYDVVMHLDNNPLNNYYKNLKWGNQAENNKQKQTDRRGNKYHDRLKLKVYRYKLRHPKATFRYISAWFGISLTKCRQICRGSDFSTKDLPNLSQHF